MSSSFGKNIKVSVFGSSHGAAIGVTVDSFPAGEKVDTEELARFMARRAPGGELSTPRKETDAPEIVSGLFENTTEGVPLTAIIKNSDTKSSDYGAIKYAPRPSHADYSAFVKYSGYSDMRGGGHFSGRLTAPLCAAGGIAVQILRRKGIEISARITEIGGVKIASANEIKPVIEKIRAEKDSVGAVIECEITGLPAGLGSPMFGGAESRLAEALYGIPGVKGVEFGSGFEGSRLRGSQNNDEFYYDADGNIRTRTNNHGGILGGITTGMPLVFRLAMKPTPSIGLPQRTVDLTTGKDTEITVAGRHDPCIALRAVPVAEACAALVILDMAAD